MATTRPFAYNTGSTVSATTQVGDLAVGTNDLPVSEGYGGLTWKNGPNEDLGYVIGYPQSGDTQPLPGGGFGNLQFWRSKIPGDDTSFIELVEFLSRKYSTPQTFANANDANIWLGSNGFWSSFEPTPTPTETSIIPTPTPSTTPLPVTGYSFNLVTLPYNFPSTGNTIMNSTAPTNTGSTNPNELTLNSRGIYWNSIDTDGIDRTSYFSQFTGQSVTFTISQTGSTAIYSGDTSAFKYWSGTTGTVPPGIPGNGFVFGTNIGIPTPTQPASGSAVLIQSASTLWVSGTPVYISAVIN